MVWMQNGQEIKSGEATYQVAHCDADHSASTPGESPYSGHLRSPVARCEKGNSARFQPSEHEVLHPPCINRKLLH